MKMIFSVEGCKNGVTV